MLDWSNTILVRGFTKLIEVLLTNISRTREEGLTMNVFIDSDNAGYLLTIRSWKRYFAYLNSALIYWHSKKWTLIEMSSFSITFITMKHATLNTSVD